MAAAVSVRVRRPPTVVMSTSWLQIKPVPETAADRAPSVQVKDDGSFVLEGLIGPTVIQIAGAKNWYVKSVQQSGRNITDEPVDFAESPAPLTVTLTQRAGTVRSGGYVALAIPLDTGPFIGATAEYFELIAKYGTRFSVSENETRQLDLRLTALR